MDVKDRLQVMLLLSENSFTAELPPIPQNTWETGP